MHKNYLKCFNRLILFRLASNMAKKDVVVSLYKSIESGYSQCHHTGNRKKASGGWYGLLLNYSGVTPMCVIAGILSPVCMAASLPPRCSSWQSLSGTLLISSCPRIIIPPLIS